jgi:hypothetical protein
VTFRSGGPSCGLTSTSRIQVHETWENFAVVTEGNPWPIGYVWERLHYDWSEAGSVKGTVIDSNLFKPESTWEIHAEPANGGSRVDVIAVRHLKGFKGKLLAPVFPPRIGQEHCGCTLATLSLEGRGVGSKIEGGDPSDAEG